MELGLSKEQINLWQNFKSTSYLSSIIEVSWGLKPSQIYCNKLLPVAYPICRAVIYSTLEQRFPTWGTREILRGSPNIFHPLIASHSI